MSQLLHFDVKQRLPVQTTDTELAGFVRSIQQTKPKKNLFRSGESKRDKK